MSAVPRPILEDVDVSMWEEVDSVIARHRGSSGAIIAALRQAQDTVGYLPEAMIDYIAAGMNLPAAEVFGVASFYSLFSLEPKGRHTIRVCTGTACYVKGIREVISRVCNAHKVEEGGTTEDRRFTLESVRCLGACGLAPVMTVNGNVHGAVKADKVLDILEDYS